LRDVGPLIARYLAQENLEAAEHVCRKSLELDPTGTTGALLGLAMIARRLGRHEHEWLFLDRLALPFTTRFHAPLSVDEISPDKFESDGQSPKYLVINAWGEGFWSDVIHVLGCCALAWLSKRVPVTNWGIGSLYSDDPSTDAFTTYFEPLTDLRLSGLDLAASTIFPGHWTAGSLSGRSSQSLPDKRHGPSLHNAWLSEASVVVCDKYVSPAGVLRWIIPAVTPGHDEIADQIAALLARFCRPKRQWRDLAAAYVQDNFGARPYVAVHLRGTDKLTEHRRSEAVGREIVENAGQAAADRPIFLMTDDNHWLDVMRSRYGNQLHTRSVTRGDGGTGVHRASLPGASQHVSRSTLGAEILCDTLIAAGSSVFIGDGESNVAAVTALMMRPRSAKAELVTPSQLLEVRDWGLIDW
jgi:hypothetical protein